MENKQKISLRNALERACVSLKDMEFYFYLFMKRSIVKDIIIDPDNFDEGVNKFTELVKITDEKLFPQIEKELATYVNEKKETQPVPDKQKI